MRIVDDKASFFSFQSFCCLTEDFSFINSMKTDETASRHGRPLRLASDDDDEEERLEDSYSRGARRKK